MLPAMSIQTERIILTALLEEPAMQWTMDELASEIGESITTIEDAVQQLDRWGLVQRGWTVHPSRAAIHCDRLLS